MFSFLGFLLPVKNLGGLAAPRGRTGLRLRLDLHCCLLGVLGTRQTPTLKALGKPNFRTRSLPLQDQLCG